MKSGNCNFLECTCLSLSLFTVEEISMGVGGLQIKLCCERQWGNSPSKGSTRLLTLNDSFDIVHHALCPLKFQVTT